MDHGSSRRGEHEAGYFGRRYGERSYGGEPVGYGRAYPERGGWQGPQRGYGGWSSGDNPSYGSRYPEPYEASYPERWGGMGTERGYGGERFGYGSYQERGYGERPLWERASDEVRSWFGNDEAERRRRMDEVRSRSQGRGPRGWRRSDERIQEDINECLAFTSGINAEEIEVSVKEGEVTLTGTVDSRSDKRQAEDIAEQVRGVTDVHNQLRIRRENAGQAQTIASSAGTGSSASSTGHTARRTSAS